MNVTEFMTQPVVTVEMDDSLLEVKSLFEKTSFHHLLVISDSELVGVISDRDLLKVLSPNIGTAAETLKDLACLNKRAHQIMSRDPITLKPDARLPEVVSVFNQHTISCIPIVDDSNAVLGIVSWRDVMKTLGLAYAKAATKPQF
ncbi:CBS domain-containing protein [Gilvimarinus sp. SDUM040013]|uniref:CBS domain-containing protein n=1 Tax=Gilvimarinus gilvus TaxID=3058038 RepID=A0ABU4S2X4_9GAMM|nr:CBS domain-containing protein [Gilvimarinus sp. SDUM040013]MDO3387572.1 CBS domain-containing protein [Gilvimarinus sp. SDUM040013]MDX6850163.1 CBS domain-containing protein [Gilvimarinus sp. SDUM040013]